MEINWKSNCQIYQLSPEYVDGQDLPAYIYTGANKYELAQGLKDNIVVQIKKLKIQLEYHKLDINSQKDDVRLRMALKSAGICMGINDSKKNQYFMLETIYP